MSSENKPRHSHSSVATIRKVVKELQPEETRKAHYEDLKQTAMVLHNEICRRFKKGAVSWRGSFFADAISEASNVVGDFDRKTVDECETTQKRKLRSHYTNHDNDVRFPADATDVLKFIKKNNKMKEVAIDAVCNAHGSVMRNA